MKIFILWTTMNFYSHKDKLLKEHLKSVGERAKEHFFFNNNNDLKELAYLIGLTHDLGKYTSFFQNHLLNEISSPLSYHSFISSLLSSYYIDSIKDRFNFETSLKELIPLISFFVVFHHHSDLTNLEKLNESLKDEEKKELLRNQIEDLMKNKDEIESELKELNIELSIPKFQTELERHIRKLRSIIFDFLNREDFIDFDKKLELAILIYALYSSLVDSDEKDAQNSVELQRVSIPENIIEKYKELVFKDKENPLRDLRENVYKKVIKNIEKIDLNKKIYTITAPTGSGKTLASFSFAIKLRNLIEKKFSYSPRIIYSLPFISIIHQNSNVFRDVFKNVLKDNFLINESKFIIEHHHLSNFKYSSEETEYLEFKDLLTFIESWDSEVIVTTFVQLLTSIFGFRKRSLKKYHNIARSILILDEVQNIPVEYWKLIEKILSLLSFYLNCYIILMTATKPLIFNTIETYELVENSYEFFMNLNRTSIFPKLEINSLDSLLHFFKDLNNKNRDKSYMIVMNTIESSKEFYKMLKENGYKHLYYLSSNIVPVQRLKRIEEIKNKIKSNEPVILVSTQVVEASVDFDFDIVVRDNGPFDSIIQVAGRCNREGIRRRNGEVYIVDLYNNKNAYFSSMVYGGSSPGISRLVLNGKEKVEEKDYFNLINFYFEKIKDIKSQEESINLLEALGNLSFSEYIGSKGIFDFKLIKEETVPIFIEIEDKSLSIDPRQIWNKFKEIINNENLKPWEKRTKFLEFKYLFDMFIVSVIKNRFEKYFKSLDIFEFEGLGHISKKDLDRYYDYEVGLKLQGGGDYMIY